MKKSRYTPEQVALGLLSWKAVLRYPRSVARWASASRPFDYAQGRLFYRWKKKFQVMAAKAGTAVSSYDTTKGRVASN